MRTVPLVSSRIRGLEDSGILLREIAPLGHETPRLREGLRMGAAARQQRPGIPLVSKSADHLPPLCHSHGNVSHL